MTELHKAQTDGVVQASTQKQNQARYTPNEIVDSAIDIYNGFKDFIPHKCNISFT